MADIGSRRPPNAGSFKPNDPRAGPKPGSRNKASREIQEVARRLLTDPAYQANLQQRLRDGKAGAVEVLLYHYAYGKPPDQVRLGGEAVAPLDIHLEWENPAAAARERMAARLAEMARRQASAGSEPPSSA